MKARHAPWLALVVGAWLCKLGYGLWLIDHCESAPSWHYLCADVASWSGFLRSARAGFIPYVDYYREYPAGIGTLYWALGSLLHTRGIPETLRLQVGLSLVFDLLGASLFYFVLEPRGRARAAAIAAISLLLPTAFILSPVRYESVVGAVVLLGYLAHRRGHRLWAAGIWSFGITLKWYPVIAIAIEELRVMDRAYFRERLPRVLAVCAAVQLAVNGPYLLGGLFEYGNIDRWLATYTFHADRRLSPDTVLGVLALWQGPVSAEHYAAWASGALAALVLCTRRSMAFEPKFVLVCVALVLVNRVYSPQFNLWFQPFLLLTLVATTRGYGVLLAGLLLLLELTTIAVFPFLYADLVSELGGALDWGSMATHAGPVSHAFTTAVLLRALALLALLAALYRAPLPRTD